MDRILIFLLTSILVTGCSSKSQTSKEDEITNDFSYTVNAKGEKAFVLILYYFEPMKVEKVVSYDKKGRAIRNRPELDKNWVDIGNLAVRRLDQILDEKGICPNSLRIDSQQQTARGYELTGVCR